MEMNVVAIRTYSLEFDEDEMAVLYRVIDFAKTVIMQLPDEEDKSQELRMIEDLQSLRYRKV